MPALLEFPKGTIFDQGAQVIAIKDGQGLVNGQAGQKDLFLASPIGFALPVLDHDGVDGIGLEILAVELSLMVGIAILVITGQPFDPVQLDLALKFFALTGSLRLKQVLTVRFGLAKSTGVGGNVHVILAGHNEINPIAVFDGPQGLSVQETPIHQQDLKHALPDIGQSLVEQIKGKITVVLVDWGHLGRHNQPQMDFIDDHHLKAIDIGVVLDILLVGQPFADRDLFLAHPTILLGGDQVAAIKGKMTLAVLECPRWASRWTAPFKI